MTENITNSSTVIPMLNDPSVGFQRVINYLQSVLSVIRASSNLYFPSSCAEPNSDGQCIRLEPQSCGDHATVPNEHLETVMVCDPTCREVGGGVDADYILYVTAVNDGKLYLWLIIAWEITSAMFAGRNSYPFIATFVYVYACAGPL